MGDVCYKVEKRDKIGSLHLPLFFSLSMQCMIDKAIKSYIKAMYIDAHKIRHHWIHFTLFIGALPLLIRFVVWLSVSGVAMSPFVIGDVVFWAIMLNVASLYNVSIVENVPDVQVGTLAAALTRTAILAAIYAAALFPGTSVYLWIAVTFLTMLSLFASYSTTDSTLLQAQQQMYDLANNIEELPVGIRNKVRRHVKMVLDDKFQVNFVDIKAEIDKYLTELKETSESVR
jgi:hypothetical protein